MRICSLHYWPFASPLCCVLFSFPILCLLSNCIFWLESLITEINSSKCMYGTYPTLGCYTLLEYYVGRQHSTMIKELLELESRLASLQDFIKKNREIIYLLKMEYKYKWFVNVSVLFSKISYSLQVKSQVIWSFSMWKSREHYTSITLTILGFV